MPVDSTNSNMDEESNLSKKFTKQDVFWSRTKRRILKHTHLLRIVIVAGIVGILVFGYLSLSKLARQTGISQQLGLASEFVFPDEEILKSTAGNTNILLLGKGGAGHDAPDLTDTIILLSVDREKKRIVQLSLPRDIWIPSLRTKLNSVYYWGNQKEEGGGVVLAKSSVEEIVGVPVHYAIVFDFSLFRDVIEILDGVQINVETAFVDHKFPIAGKEADDCGGDPGLACRYETVEFEKGLQSMDADTALKFVRSRNAEGDEGTDIARGRRQQKLIDAVIAKAATKDFFLSPKRAFAVVNTVLAALETDLRDEQLASVGRYLFDSRGTIESLSIPDDLLENPRPSPTYDNLYVFIPAAGDWKEVHAFINEILQ